MRYKFNISSLDCANCAKKIEDALNKDKNIDKAIVNFSSLKLTIETDLSNDVLKYVNKIVKKIEPETTIYDKNVRTENVKKRVLILLIGTIIGLLGLFFKTNNIVKNFLIIISYIILLHKTALKAIRMLIQEKSLNENFLITISCIGAYLIDKQSEGLMVIVLYEIGKILEGIAINNSRKSISDLMNIKPSFANKKVDDKIIVVSPEEVKVEDIIIVKTGEKIPLDGVILEGTAKLNTSAITGESILKPVKEGDSVTSGMINENGLITVKVNTIYEDSTVNKILELTLNATDNKAKTETTVSKLSKIYTPSVFLLAILLSLYGAIFTSQPLNTWIYKSLVFLVISCPCAIAISVPLSYFAGIGLSSKCGILIKGSNYLDNLKNINRIIFDKTGTITTGKFENIDIKIINEKYSKKEIETILKKGESLSNHPLAKSITDVINIKTNSSDVENFKEIKGSGISFSIGKENILIGNYKLCKCEDIGAVAYISIDGLVVAAVNIVDKIKDNAKPAIKKLQNKNIICEMFTGDSKNNAIKVAKEVGIKEVKYEMLPSDKYTCVKEYIDNNIVAFVGDGINDAPTLALAHIGISMGVIGTDAAIEASDVVIMTDDLSKINTAIDISRYTNKIIRENLIFAISLKILVLVLSALGISNMWQAVFADVGVTLLTILNTLRILKKKR